METHDTRTAADLTPFEFSGSRVRALMIDGEPWVVAADACALLGLRNPSSSLALLDDDEKGLHSVETPSGPQQMVIVSEPGLNQLVMRSRRPEAKAIRRWIAHEVMPAIRRTGAYSLAPALPQSYAEALRALAAEVEAKEVVVRALEAATPKAEAWESMVEAGGDLSLTAAAKALQSGGARVKAREFLLYLHEKRWIYRAGGVGDWLPYAEAITAGWMTIRLVSDRSGKVREQARVTVLGMERARAMLVADRGVEAQQTSLQLVVAR